MQRELRSRLIFGPIMALGIIVMLVGDAYGGWHWGALTLAFGGALLGCREFARLARVHAAEVQPLPMIVVSAALVIAGHLAGAAQANALHDGWKIAEGHLARQPVTALLLALGFIWVVVAQMIWHGTTRFFHNVGATMLGMLYVGMMFQLLLRLAWLGEPGNPGRGTQLVLLLVATVKLGDVAAFTGGKLTGRHKMVPSISPGKTWEGFAWSFLGAIGGAYLFSAVLAAVFPHPPFAGWWQPLVWGLVLGPLGVAGDLAESAMKRDAAVKDSGTGVPGFGGFLDLFDALVLATPVAYVLALVL